MTREEARKRAKELLEKMTVEEKISQLVYDSRSVERLGIPSYNWWNEALHGVARAGLATVFPQAIGMAASFDKKLIYKVATAIADEARAKYNAAQEEGDHGIYKGLTFWSPNINIFRDPRWGRGQETYGEDPYLTAAMGTEFVKGLQGDGEFMKAAACAKHYAVHSGPEKGRHGFDAQVDDRDLFDTYLPAFERLVKDAKVEAVMGAYNRVNGEPACASKRLLIDILRGDWGFEGHVVSDCGAIADFHKNHHVTSSADESAALALKAGCDLNCGCVYASGNVLLALEKGLITEEDIDRSVLRLLTTRFLLGMFEEKQPYIDVPLEIVDCPEHRELNLKMARESIVLLKNDGILPLDPAKLKSVAVIGPVAQSYSVLEGNYCGKAGEYTTLADGIRRMLPDARVHVVPGSELYRDRSEANCLPNDGVSQAAAYARRADVTILCVGLDPTIEGEEGVEARDYADGDKRNLLLPKSQQCLVEAVCDVTDRVIVITTAGSCIDLGVANTKARAILHAWYPGARGGEAVADILFGRVSPSARLPVTFYYDNNNIPDITDYRMENRTYRYLKEEPLYPFGYGLSYTTFEYSDFSVEKKNDGSAACVSVTNTGSRFGREVTQIYAKIRDSRYKTPNFQLCGIDSVELAPGETARLNIPVSDYWLKVVTDDGKRVAPDGGITLYAGGHQPDELSVRLCGTKCLEVRV
ncbi:MAG TPA: glycoside hydrolase family 3 N-terminal domain-containing protein [Clostridiales bacterium]|nr:glycoside hydrolase family 3 N-terminal domain-containing protein [Clostridiales bacterium]HPU67724.1 glycoside hydrolase family 3 N-terminal domain-containing protein [Clostridiales bacterium]